MLKKDVRIEKVYYSIGEVAELFEVRPSLIRFWEKEFTLLKPQKNKKGNRLFTARDIEHFRLIYHLVKEKGYTIQGARDYLAKNRTEAEKNQDLIDTLKNIRQFLVDLDQKLY